MKDKNTDRMNSKRIVAIIGIALLLLLYLATLIAAFADSSVSAQWFRLCLGGTLVIPLVVWLYSWMYGRLTGKPAPGDPDADDAAVSPQETAPEDCDVSSGKTADTR